MSWIKVSPLNQVPINRPFPVSLEGKEYVLVKDDTDKVVLFLDSCPHQDLPLSGGDIVEGKIECPFHGAQFCLKTGDVKALPANNGLQFIPTRITDGVVEVDTNMLY